MSREIDALVAEHVMGWKWFKDPDNFKPGAFFLDSGKEVRDWYPSINISQALEIVTRLNQEGWSCTLYNNPIPNRNGVVFHNGGQMFGHLKVGIQLPWAICLAALKAKGVPVADKS